MIPNRFSGKAYVVGDNIDTDAIIPARYLTTMDPKRLAVHAMDDLDPRQYPIPFLNPDKSCDYKIIIAGRNFACGSSREHAPIALQAAGINVVIAKSYSRIFYRNSINGGRLILPLESDEDLDLLTKTGQELEIILKEEKIVNLTTNTKHRFKPFGPVKEILDVGGLTAHNKRRLGI